MNPGLFCLSSLVITFQLPFQAVYGLWNALLSLNSEERNYRNATALTIQFVPYSGDAGGKIEAESRGERKWRSKDFINGVLFWLQTTGTDFPK